MSVGVLSATGLLGTGFRRESFEAGLVAADVVGCDAGSTDLGPYYLGSGRPHAAQQAVRRDLEIMLEGAHEKGLPLIVGSAGTAGGQSHVEWTAQIVQEIALDRGWHLNGAKLYSDVDVPTLTRLLADGRVTPLAGAAIGGREPAEHGNVVAMMGHEPIGAALRGGAQVVVAGRSSDSAIFAAVPLSRGVPAGVAWHAGKILECGAASTEHRMYPDCLVAELDSDRFVVRPPNPEMRCTPASVASHSLYENVDPGNIVEPGGSLDTSSCTYSQRDHQSVEVTGSKFVSTSDYTVKLEGSALVGYRSVVLGGITEPVILDDLDGFTSGIEAVVRAKAAESLGIDGQSFSITWRSYGAGAVLANERVSLSQIRARDEVGLVMEVIAPSQSEARQIMSICWHTALHHPLKAYAGLTSNLAIPFSPPDLDGGPVYNFTLNHVAHLDDPLDLFRIVYTDFGG
jgi:hypothetical protein